MKVGYIAYLYFLYFCNMIEENLRATHRILLVYLKVIPMLLAFIYALNTLFSYFGIDLELLSYIGGVSILPMIFIYLASYAFRFCKYHRMFIHYILFNWLLNIYDYYIGIPLSARNLFAMYLIIFVIFLFLILYYHQKAKKEGKLHNIFI